MRKLVIATKNEKKKKELIKLLKGLNIKILNLSDLKMHLPHVVEDGRTFRQNAVKKALTFSRYIKELILADDSGLVVEALDGKPGVRSSRFAHTKAKDEENNAKLLKLMKDVPLKKRGATFVSVVAIAKEGNLIGTRRGECKGTIGFEPEGKNGFGYDPLFIPKGKSRTFAQFSSSFKNRISHRAKAVKKAKSIIKKCL
ncbi:MAG: RdgB/HAM1 family non-canonical purine NTP pyrophosphatase [Candidatus Omnitrophota bacterium]|nr:MAG: RdgB/HAM1 family non-canonical purine NTP pyrophosphatase [Candidatus Omnitrophota bacterium]